MYSTTTGPTTASCISLVVKYAELVVLILKYWKYSTT